MPAPTPRPPLFRHISTELFFFRAERFGVLLRGSGMTRDPSGPWLVLRSGWSVLRKGVQWLVGRVSLLRSRRSEVRLALAGGLITDNAGRYLLIHRSMPGMSWWEVPGGKVEAGEDPWETARRELSEELSVAVERLADLGSAEFRHGDQVLQYTWYVVRIQDGDPKVVERDRFDQLRFFTWDELVSLREHASPSVRCLVERRGPHVGDVLAGLKSNPPSALESAPAS